MTNLKRLYKSREKKLNPQLVPHPGLITRTEEALLLLERMNVRRQKDDTDGSGSSS